MALAEKIKSSTNGHAAPAPEAPTAPLPEIADEIRQAARTGADAAHETAADLDDILPIDSLADWLENGLQESMQRQTAGALAAPESATATAPPVWAPRQGETPVSVSGKSDPFAGQGIEIGVEIYVEILEACSSALGQWWARDDASDFNFNAKLKERYKKITILYANSQNIQVSPGFLFAAFTLLLLSQSAIKAHRRRNELIKIEAYKRRTAAKLDSQSVPATTRQLSMFPADADTDTQRGAIPAQPRIYTAEIPDRGRKSWKIDPGGYYTHTPEGDYLKQSDRRERPSPPMQAFIDTFKERHNRAPENKEVKLYLKTV